MTAGCRIEYHIVKSSNRLKGFFLDRKVRIIMEYNAIDVAKYIVFYCIGKNYSISNLKLQKLLYFVQAYFLINLGRPCFFDTIEAWDFGPVVPNVYHTFKMYGGGQIPYFYADEYDIKDAISDDDKKRIGVVVDSLAKYTASDLVEATHKQDPWKNVYNPHVLGTEITNLSIKEYFDGLRKK